MSESLEVAINLFSVRRVHSRPKEITTYTSTNFRCRNKSKIRPLSGQSKRFTPTAHHPISRKTMNFFKSSSNQFQKDITKFQELEDQKIDLISSSSTLEPPTLKELLEITADSFCVINKQSKKVIYQHQPDKKRQIASLTKMMTAYTVMHICKEFNVDVWTTMIRVEKEAAYMEGTTANLRLGDQLSVIDLLHGMMLPSGNDAAVALAQYFGKFISFTINREEQQTESIIRTFQQKKPFYDENYSKEALRLFVFKMNYLSHHQLKLKNTYFTNPTGLQHYRSYSTAYDMTLLASGFMQSSILSQIASKKIYQCQIQNSKLFTFRTVTWRNTNSLLWKKKDCSGLKTGYTPMAGSCLASVFGFLRHPSIIIVVLGSSDNQNRFTDSQKLYSEYKRRV